MNARLWLPVFLLCAASLAAQTPDSASDPKPASPPQTQAAAATGDSPMAVLKMNVKLVNVFTNVTDATGAVVGGLTKEDFSVTEDGRPQRIAVFERQSELPLNLVLAIDTSGSVHKDLALEQDAARRFVHALLRAQDQMSLLEFSTLVRPVVPFTNQPSFRIGPTFARMSPGTTASDLGEG